MKASEWVSQCGCVTVDIFSHHTNCSHSLYHRIKNQIKSQIKKLNFSDTHGKYSPIRRSYLDPCRLVGVGEPDLRVSLLTGIPTSIPIMSHRLPALVLSLRHCMSFANVSQQKIGSGYSSFLFHVPCQNIMNLTSNVPQVFQVGTLINAVRWVWDLVSEPHEISVDPQIHVEIAL